MAIGIQRAENRLHFHGLLKPNYNTEQPKIKEFRKKTRMRIA